MNEAQTVDNGVNVEALLGAREALTEAPAAAQFVWRAESEWQNGAHTRSTINQFFGLGEINQFFGLGEMQDRGQQFTVDTDHPEVFAAADQAPTPVEMVLVGLAGCLTGGIASVAQNRGIQLHSVKATLEAPMDLAGILGIDPDVRNGFKSLTVSYQIHADATEDEIAALVAQSQKRSAVFDIITNPTNVDVQVNK
ncbi:MAG: OsmC family protein [Woeseiaceae bacterium]